MDRRHCRCREMHSLLLLAGTTRDDFAVYCDGIFTLRGSISEAWPANMRSPAAPGFSGLILTRDMWLFRLALQC